MKVSKHSEVLSNYISHWLTRQKKGLKMEQSYACLHLITSESKSKSKKACSQIAYSTLGWKSTKETVQENDLYQCMYLHFTKCRKNRHFLGGGCMALTRTEFRPKIRVVFCNEGLLRSNDLFGQEFLCDKYFCWICISRPIYSIS